MLQRRVHEVSLLPPTSHPDLPSLASPSKSMPDYFPNASNFSIGDSSNLSTVHGNQHNNYQIKIGKKSRRKRFSLENEEEEERLAEYCDVRLGNIVIGKELGSSASKRFDYDKLEWVVGCERKSFAAVVLSKGGKVTSTVVSYHGPEKEEAWKKDFHQFSGALNATNVQVLGYNRSETPLLLLHNNLVPLAHFLDSVGGLGLMYLQLLRAQLRCRDSELWLDSSRGVLCRGPEGPDCDITYGISSDLPVVLSDGKLLQEDALVQYLATLKRSRDLDRKVARWLSYFSFASAEPSDMRVDRPTVISSLTNTTIAVADTGMSSIRARGSSCLGEREVLSNGLTRFKLEHHGRHLELDWNWWEAKRAWVAQSPMVFHAHGISMEANLNLIVPYISNGTLSQSRTKRRRRQKCAPIYLFTRPSQASTFWSFEEDGHLPIPDDLCSYLGLPVKLSLKCIRYPFSTQTYKAMRDYQILRGFDPTTADFAQDCGLYDYEFHPVQPSLAVASTTSGRFENLDNLGTPILDNLGTPILSFSWSAVLFTHPHDTHVASVGAKSEDVTVEDLESVYRSLPTLFGDIPVEDDMPQATEPSRATVWSGLGSSLRLSQAAWKVSDILAMGF
ncbi:hypothetical protein V5O48_018365 [Marasmius crinis-equi]|uniref:Uncharacterized protein n=1 Tax=Marasmius crinis-equi TaxID=585013 RepID=A0ABR3ELD7_9AGAR